MALALGVTSVLAVVFGLWLADSDRQPVSAIQPTSLPTAPASYLGWYADGVPASYSGVQSISKTVGVRPNLVSYYSGWLEPFWKSFAVAAAEHGAVPVVQMNPAGVSIAAIAAGRYDNYLITFAKAVKAYGRPVVLSFGHEMNGRWYSWGYTHTGPEVFVAAWRHLVHVFGAQQARNVTWLWTVNIMKIGSGIRNPAAWWPGKAYVTWVGIDGYYHIASAQFASVFGPTIAAVREITQEPILIAETGASSAAGQAAKIAGLFAGVREYRLLGFIWFDVESKEDYRITSREAIAAFRHAAESYHIRAF